MQQTGDHGGRPPAPPPRRADICSHTCAHVCADRAHPQPWGGLTDVATLGAVCPRPFSRPDARASEGAGVSGFLLASRRLLSPC